MILYCNVAYMKLYDSDKPEDMVNGGAYIKEHGTGIEIDNFHVFDEGMCYGGVETGAVGGDRRNLCIERLDPKCKKADSIPGVTVVFCARPARGKTVIVGWYDNAAVYRKYQYITDNRDGNPEREYNIMAKSSDCYLIPESMRNPKNLECPGFIVPRISDKLGYGIGQSQVWYGCGNTKNLTEGQIAALKERIEAYHRSVIAYLDKMRKKLSPLGGVTSNKALQVKFVL